MEEKLILPRVKVEALLTTNLGLRPCSQITIPAEFPGGIDMGMTIDKKIEPAVRKIQTVKDAKAKYLAVQVVKKKMGELFEECVEDTDQYRTLYSWADRLGLRKNQVPVRPTVHEIYIYKDRGFGRELNRVLNARLKLRRKVQRKPGPNMTEVRFAFPEEFDRKWILQMGKLLGYPSCCVERYADDRLSDTNVELRAANQLKEALEEGDVDNRGYPLGFFFPCQPDCPNAVALGKKIHSGLAELNPSLGELYSRMIELNLTQVLKQPELIAQYLNQFQPKEDQ